MWRSIRLLDAGLTVGIIALLLICGAVDDNPGDIGLLDGGLTVLVCAPLLVRARWPVPVLVWVTLGTFAILGAYKPESALAPVILALYTVAVTGEPRRTVITGVAMAPTVGLGVMVFTPHGLLSMAWMALPLALGASIRHKRLYFEEIRDRAERAERTREEEARRRVGEERLRIARELHDVVAHAMVAINVQAGVAAHLLERDPTQAAGSLQEIKRVSGQALTDLRATLGVLRDAAESAPRAPAEKLAGLDDVAAAARAAGVAVDVAIVGDRTLVPVTVDAAAYRIVQEALTNVLRHSGAERARVQVAVAGETLTVEVSDDGVGAAANGNGGGHGLRGMRERVVALGGELRAGARPEGGWQVHAQLPLAAPAAVA